MFDPDESISYIHYPATLKNSQMFCLENQILQKACFINGIANGKAISQ